MGAHVVHARGERRDFDGDPRVGEEQARGQRRRNLGGARSTGRVAGHRAVGASDVVEGGVGQVEQTEGAVEVGVGEVRTFQRAAHEVHQHRVLEVGSGEVGTAEVNVDEDGFAEVDTGQIGAREVRVRQVNPAHVAVSEVLAGEVEVGPVAVHQQGVGLEECHHVGLFATTGREVELDLLPHEREVFGLGVAGCQQDVVEAIFVPTAVRTGQVEGVRCVLAGAETASSVGRRGSSNVFTGQRLFAPPKHVVLAVEQHEGLQRIAAVGVSKRQFRHAGPHRRDPVVYKLTHEGQGRRFVERFLEGDLEVRAHRRIDRFLVHQRPGVALHGSQRNDGEGEQHDDRQAVDRFGRTGALEAPLDVLQQRGSAEDDLHDLRSLGADASKQQRTADPQGEGPEDADEPFDEEVRDQPVLAAVGFQPGITDGQHPEPKGEPVQPSLGFGLGGRLAHAFLDFEFDEATRPTPTEEQRQAEGGEGREQGGAHAEGGVDVKVPRSEFHEPDR